MTSDIRGSDTAVCQALRRFVVQTPMDCDGELVPDSICHIESVQVGT